MESILIRTAGSLLSGRGRNAALLVMIYHRVARERDPLLPSEPDAATFATHMDLLATHFNVLPLADAMQRLANGSLPRRAVCITFDDGYANNYEVALPILSARRLAATVFVAPGFLNGGRMFNDTVIEAVRRAEGVLDLRREGLGEFHLSNPESRVQALERIITGIKHIAPNERLELARSISARAGIALPDDLMMTDDQVRALHRAGIEIGAHTMTHPILTKVADEVARDEIVASKRALESMIDAPIKSFAYPNGKPGRDYAEQHVRMARESGFDCALSTAWGAATMASDRFQIPRIAPWDATMFKFAARMLRAYRERA